MTSAGPGEGTGAETTATKSETTVTPECLDIETPAQLHRRAASSYRLQMLDCLHGDPLRCLADELPIVVTSRRFGLTEAEARKHANALAASGWSIDEIVATLGVRPKRTAA